MCAMIGSMELRHLRYFLAVAEEQGFARAARRLHISQPPLSRQIRELEEELGVQLLIRDNRSVELTDAGREMLDRTRSLLSSLADAIKTVRSAGNGTSGGLTVEAAPSFCQRLAPLMEGYSRQHPSMALELCHDFNCSAVRDLLDKKAAAIFTRERVSDARLESRQLFAEKLVAIVPKDHPLSRKRKIAIADLESQPLRIFARQASPALFHATQNFLATTDLEPSIVGEIQEDQLDSCFVAVATGRGIAIGTDSMEILGAGRKKIKFVPIAFDTPDLHIFLVWRKRDKSPPLRLLLSLTDFFAISEGIPAV